MKFRLLSLLLPFFLLSPAYAQIDVTVPDEEPVAVEVEVDEVPPHHQLILDTVTDHIKADTNLRFFQRRRMLRAIQRPEVQARIIDAGTIAGLDAGVIQINDAETFGATGEAYGIDLGKLIAVLMSEEFMRFVMTLISLFGLMIPFNWRFNQCEM